MCINDVPLINTKIATTCYAGDHVLQQQTGQDERVRLLTCEELVAAFQNKAAEAAAAAGLAAGFDAEQVQ